MNKYSTNGEYIGTMHVGGDGPIELWQVGGQVVVRPAFARRKNRFDRLVEFVRACRLWRRVQRYGSEA